MKSLITDLPDGAEVTFRSIQTRTVEVVYGHDDLYFSAIAPEHRGDDCEFYGRSLIADSDLPLVKRGAPFWLVVEKVNDPHNYPEQWSAIAFQHPGIETAEEAFAARTHEGGESSDG